LACLRRRISLILGLVREVIMDGKASGFRLHV